MDTIIKNRNIMDFTKMQKIKNVYRKLAIYE